VLAPYLAAHDLKTLDRWPGQVAAVVAALGSPVVTVREDAARYLAWYPTLSRDFREDQVPGLVDYLGSAAPIEERGSVANAMVSAHVAGLVPSFRTLADRDDATGAMALRALAGLGSAVDADRLPGLSRAKSPEVRSYAAEALGERAASDPSAAERAGQILGDAAEKPAVRAAAAEGLGRAGSAVRPTLLAAVRKGDEASRAAAMALAAGGDQEAGVQLLGVLKDERGEAAMAAAAALVTLKDCPACVDGLRQQHEKHPDEEVRHLLGVLLEVPLVHKH
jgi:HEAT repeat protein